MLATDVAGYYADILIVYLAEIDRNELKPQK